MLCLYLMNLSPGSKKYYAIYAQGRCSSWIKINEHSEAIGVYDQILRINPKDVNALKYKVRLWHSLRKYNQAIECFNKILEHRSQGRRRLE